MDGFAVLGGSSALAEELPKYWPPHEFADPLAQINVQDHNGVLVVAGSLMPQTAAQTAHFRAMGMPVMTIDTRLSVTLRETRIVSQPETVFSGPNDADGPLLTP